MCIWLVMYNQTLWGDLYNVQFQGQSKNTDDLVAKRVQWSETVLQNRACFATEPLVPISTKQPCFQNCCFVHIHFITQPHFRRFQMAPGNHSWATLICFIYLGTNRVHVRAYVEGKGTAVSSCVIQVGLCLLPIRSQCAVYLIWQCWSNHSQLSHKRWHKR